MLTVVGKIRMGVVFVAAVLGGTFTASVVSDKLNIAKNVQAFKEATAKDDDEMDDDDDDESDPEDGNSNILEMMASQNSAQAADPVQ